MLCNRKEKGQNLFHLCLKLTFLERRRETSKQNIRIHLCTIPVHKRDIVKVIVIAQQSNILKQKRERYNNERYNNERYNNERYNNERYRTPGERCSSDFAGPWSMVRSECTLCLRLAGNLHARPPPIVHFDLCVHCVLLGLQIVIVHVLFQLMFFAQSEMHMFKLIFL